jgi:hypothetical protein
MAPVGRSQGLASALVLLTLAFLIACGRVPDSGAASTESPSTSSPSPSASPSPSGSPNAFLPGDCVYPETGGTPTQPLNDNFKMVITIPTSWTRATSGQDETTLATLTAPSSYSFTPTTMRVQSLLGYFPNLTPAQTINQYFPQSGMGVVESCTVSSDHAAFVQYTQGTHSGYFILWLHFNYAYSVTLDGTGGMDPRSIQDAKGVLASVTWTVLTPPSR